MKRSRIIFYVSIVAILVAMIALRGPVHTGPLKTVYKNTYSSPQEFEEGIYNATEDLTHALSPSEWPFDGRAGFERRGVTQSEGSVHRIRAVIIPHHLVSSTAIATGIAALKGQSFKKIVMLSPDHFFQCEKTLCTTNATYQTFFGDVSADASTIIKLTASPIVSDNPNLFKTEHGIFADVPFIAHDFPGVSVTPIALNVKTWKLHQEELKQLIESVLDDQTILVVSSDFSHYLPLAKSNETDEQTAETIFAKDLDGISKLNNSDQSDCPGCLWVLASMANDQGFYNPSVLMHTNSATILRDEKIPSTTSHFAMVWYANDVLDGHDVAVGGDVTITRGNARRMPDTIKNFWAGQATASEQNNKFRGNRLAGDGIRVVNLEGPLSNTCTPSDTWYIFCNPLSRFDQVKNLATHFGVMNNHMLDQGVNGLAITKQWLEQAGKIPVDSSITETDSVRIVALTEIMNPVTDAAAARISQTEKNVLQELQDHPSPKLTVVYVHGGDEYTALASDAWTKRWEQFIDAGADAVMVVHSHIPGDTILYKNKPIFRGLGNFVFDQYDAVSKQTAKLVRLRKENGDVKFETLVADVR